MWVLTYFPWFYVNYAHYDAKEYTYTHPSLLNDLWIILNKEKKNCLSSFMNLHDAKTKTNCWKLYKWSINIWFNVLNHIWNKFTSYHYSLYKTHKSTKLYKICMKKQVPLIGSTFLMNKLCENDYGKQPIKDLLIAKSKT